LRRARQARLPRESGRRSRRAARRRTLPASRNRSARALAQPFQARQSAGRADVPRRRAASSRGGDGDARRIALEAYPGLLARAIESASYKSDERRKQTPERESARKRILAALLAGSHPLALRLECESATRELLVADASGDSLDAALALVQAAWAWQRRERNFGLPEAIDPVEGWILGVT
jgi:hypothetical protein